MMETRLLIPDRGVAGEEDSQQRCQSSLLLFQQEVRLDHLGQSGGRSGGWSEDRVNKGVGKEFGKMVEH